MEITKQEMPETMYRASRLCRVMGNPTAYLVVRCLDRDRKTPGELSTSLRIPLTTISTTLRHLRQMEVVRYETSGKTKEYWLKDLRILRILNTIEDWVESMRGKRK